MEEKKDVKVEETQKVTTIIFNVQQLNNTIAFLNRINLNAKEVPAFIEVIKLFNVTMKTVDEENNK